MNMGYSRLLSWAVVALSLDGVLSFLGSVRTQRILPISGVREWLESKETSNAKLLDCAILPFGLTEVLLPGQTRYLHFYEERCVKLGEWSQRENNGVLAMAYSGSSSTTLLSVCTLVEIDEYVRMDLGIGLTVRGVGRVEIEEVTGVEPFFKARVRPYEDENEDELSAAYGVGAEASTKLPSNPSSLAEKLYVEHEALQAQEAEAGLASTSESEIIADPRAILKPGERWTPDLGLDKKRGSEKGQDGSMPQVSSQTLRDRVRLARAVQTRSISAVPRDEAEAGLERTLLSFLALEGGQLKAKVKALLSLSLTDRLALASESLAERTKLLAAKRTLKSIVGS